ncbi:hypothetical protein Bca4012_023267 [Brassica carinata]
MATTADPAPTKKSRNSRKALKQKNEIVTETPSSPVSVAKGKSFEKDLLEMQMMLEKMRIEKDKTEELLKEKDEILRKKEEELVTRDAEQEKLKTELKKLQKMKDAEEKKPYEEKYQVEREAYLQVIAKEKREREAMKLLDDEQKQKTAMDLLDQYLQFVQEGEQDNKKKSKKQKDPLKPKHPISAFLVYANQRRAELREENKNVVEIAKMTGEEWKNLSDKQKAPFEEVAKKNKETYLQAMEEYKRTKEEEAMSQKKEEEELLKLHKQEALQLLKKKEKTDNLIKKKKETKTKKNENVDPNKPKKPASSFFLFSKDARKTLTEERPGTSNSTVTALISVKWKELGEEEKQSYNNKAAKLMEAYKKELEDYNKKNAAATTSG